MNAEHPGESKQPPEGTIDWPAVHRAVLEIAADDLAFFSGGYSRSGPTVMRGVVEGDLYLSQADESGTDGGPDD